MRTLLAFLLLSLPVAACCGSHDSLVEPAGVDGGVNDADQGPALDQAPACVPMPGWTYCPDMR